jgi:hypothetical protein
MNHLGFHHGVLFYGACHLLTWLIRRGRPRAVLAPTNLSVLEAKQVFFATCLARFIQDAAAQGYFATVGEAWRSPETCALYAKEDKGVVNSFHINRLAIDLNFFYHGALISTATEYAPLGKLWESYSTVEHKCTAGVFFKTRVDSDHFSVDEL